MKLKSLIQNMQLYTAYVKDEILLCYAAVTIVIINVYRLLVFEILCLFVFYSLVVQ